MAKDRKPSAPAEDLFEASTGFEAPFGAPAPTRQPELAVQLPAAVLVVDDDRERGAQTAAKLIAHGYTCRWVPEVGLDLALSQERFEALLLELNGPSSADALASAEVFPGGVVVSSPSVVALNAPAGILLLKPWLSDQAIRALEEARRRAGAEPHLAPPIRDEDGDATERTVLAPDVVEAARESTPEVVELPSQGEASAVRPLAEPQSWQRFEARVARARLFDLRHEGSIPGRVRRARFDGQLEIEARRPVGPEGCPVEVELLLTEGRTVSLRGRVELDGVGSMIVALELAEQSATEYRAWVEECLDPSVSALEVARVRAVSEPRAPTPGTDEIEALWDQARTQLDDDAAQQRFIQACLREGAVEFAVGRYRRLKEASPGDSRPQRYLAQVGTILGFYALKQDALVEEAGLSLPLKLVLAAFVLAAALLLVMAALMR